ncbi:MAG: hypothetical protein QNJ70_17265 [Xenococcaceae cyanobacterium MO_207.B15]|nr:hypothetical protein [Xenococcaceae cyanobacterium MO_207.B15]MDJ0743347.1 hypothetical protein [Xenococcaceae cyanobacterium MO_167.B27]
MEVENVYQDSEGKWHIDYSSANLMGLAIRVYFGQFLLFLFIGIPLMILSALLGFAYANSLPDETDSSQKLNVQQELILNCLADQDVD